MNPVEKLANEKKISKLTGKSKIKLYPMRSIHLLAKCIKNSKYDHAYAVYDMRELPNLEN